ncbi:hypothetical protein [Thalassospira xiamenensis]|uniref:Uncharacterized protein n=1 Tax=Thalassospira xiamenensis TaxID=220697 RepID=A0A285TRP4_9PROT|nr:hypothetical protein [Thalassospira xiamenensis]SOC26037.1 hypothetical protein SAMN05428964_10534 [Thalassospira xiamenensis]
MKHEEIYLDPDFRKSPKGPHCHICQRALKGNSVRVYVSQESNWSNAIHPEDIGEVGDYDIVNIGPECSKIIPASYYIMKTK